MNFWNPIMIDWALTDIDSSTTDPTVTIHAPFFISSPRPLPCPGNCSGNGLCSRMGTCLCDSRYTGCARIRNLIRSILEPDQIFSFFFSRGLCVCRDDCSHAVCVGGCLHGTCVASDLCVCAPGYFGRRFVAPAAMM